MMITYGHEITSDEDPFIALAEEGVKTIVSASRPGAFMVEWLPFCRFNVQSNCAYLIFLQ